MKNSKNMRTLIRINFLFILNICFAQENSSILCGDGIDNDGDGLIDCLDNDCVNLFSNGCQTCFEDGTSFADVVIEYNQNSPQNTHINPEAALGISDFSNIDAFEYVSLGDDGFIKLGFTNNFLVNSGDNGPDLWVFEVGFAVEETRIDLKPYDQNTIDILINAGINDADGDGYFEFSEISGSTSSLDIDAFVTGFAVSELIFDAVKITNLSISDVLDNFTPGADIDAVCALSSIKEDCNGVLKGSAEVDQCGLCLDRSDPTFNQSCADCSGTPNGTAVLDECETCLKTDDPNFNQLCLDCEGILNGTAMLDDCGVCLQPDDPNFGKLCVLVPNAFSPNEDGANDSFRLYARSGTSPTVTLYQIFNRYGQLLYTQQNFDFSSNTNWWNGKNGKGKSVEIGSYIYYVSVLFENGENKIFKGNVTLVR